MRGTLGRVARGGRRRSRPPRAWTAAAAGSARSRGRRWRRRRRSRASRRGDPHVGVADDLAAEALGRSRAGCSVTALRAHDARAAGARGAAPLFFRRERFEHPLRDVEARAAIDRFLQDEVEFLGLGDLLDHAVGALEQRLQLLVAPQVEVFAILALQALEIERDARAAPALFARRSLSLIVIGVFLELALQRS